MKILLTGANGMLGHAIAHEFSKFPCEILKTDKVTCDITDETAVESVFNEFGPDVVINCAAYTLVDKAEEQVELANRINGTGPRILAAACSKSSAKLVHFSTDYVFSGKEYNEKMNITSGYKEDYEIAPINAYGASKAIGEKAILSEVGDNGEYYIVRTAWLYGPNGPNFVETILKLGLERDSLNVVNDQHGSPTLTNDLAIAVAKLIGLSGDHEYACGIYHLTNEGHTTWYEYTKEIFNIAGITCNLVPVLSSEFQRAAARPANSILEQTRGPKLRNWKDALNEYINHLR